MDRLLRTASLKGYYKTEKQGRALLFLSGSRVALKSTLSKIVSRATALPRLTESPQRHLQVFIQT